MLLCMIFKLGALLIFELFALMGALFLLAYINKQQLSKWYKYAAGCVLGAAALLFICTAIGSMCCHGQYKKGGDAKCSTYKSCAGGEQGDYNYCHKSKGSYGCTKSEGKKCCSKKEYSHWGDKEGKHKKKCSHKKDEGEKQVDETDIDDEKEVVPEEE